jgi:hypothetical protein
MGVRRVEDYDTTLSVADVVEAADEIERLWAERAEARAYLSRLLQIRHPTVEPLPDLLGVCTQIDNALAGLLAERDRLREALGDKDEALLRVAQWAEAYPEDIFPPVDVASAREKLGDDALFSRLHAEWARHLCKGIGAIARAALKKVEHE